MNLFQWIERTLQPRACNSEVFFYNEMESQSGYALPLIYQPFDPHNRNHWSDRGALFDFLFATDGEGKRLLDFGPGDGWPSLIVAPFAAQVVGVDGSRQRVTVCTHNAERLGITNARFIHVEPGQPLPFPDGDFDGVMAASSLEQTPDPQAALRELYRVLRPGGRLRMLYENLGRYQNGREQEADLDACGQASCWLTLYDRRIAQEQASMFRLKLDMPLEAAQRAFACDDNALLWAALSLPKLQSLRDQVMEARICTLTHPSSQTWLAWLKAVGFRQVQPTHAGLWFAHQLFGQIQPEDRPNDMDAVDRLLRPLVKVVIELEAPLRLGGGIEPMITAVK